MRIAERCPCCHGREIARSPAVLMPFIAARVFGWEPVAVTADWGLRDLAPGQAYSICATLACADCSLLFLDIRFDEAELAALYVDYRGPAYSALRERFEPGYERRNALLNAGSPYIPAIERFLEPHVGAAPRLLDWGGDTGINTPFRGRARLHHVFDISQKPVVEGAVRVGQADIEAGSYDLIVSSNVLEHVPDPVGLVRAMAAAMTADTILYIEVPHEDAVRLIPERAARAAAKRHWHEHINFFTPEALDALLVRAGLTCIERISHPVSAGGKDSHVFSLVARRLG